MALPSIQTDPDRPKGTVLIVMNNGQVEEVISDIGLDVRVIDAKTGGYSGYPSRPLWQFLEKLIQLSIK